MKHLNESMKLYESQKIDTEDGLLKVLKKAYKNEWGFSPLALWYFIHKSSQPQWDYWYEILPDAEKDEVLAAQKLLKDNVGCEKFDYTDDEADIMDEIAAWELCEPMKTLKSQYPEFAKKLSKVSKDNSFFNSKYVGIQPDPEGVALLYWPKKPFGEKVIKLLTPDAM